uniref:Uncharacterized protein n=1 Tax=Arundo donax TaxID=35708 RepID=A0A0A9E9J9_ARUDO
MSNRRQKSFHNTFPGSQLNLRRL